MGDFNAGPGPDRRRRADRHRAEPRRARQADALEHDADDPGEGRPARSWSPAAPGGRTIINTVLLTILNVVDFGMNAQEAVDAGVPPSVAARSDHGRAVGVLARHAGAAEGQRSRHSRDRGQGVAEVIVFDAENGVLEGGVDRRRADGSSGRTMSEHIADDQVGAARARTFTDNRYSRAHQWDFDGGVTVPASSSPSAVRCRSRIRGGRSRGGVRRIAFELPHALVSVARREEGLGRRIVRRQRRWTPRKRRPGAVGYLPGDSSPENRVHRNTLPTAEELPALHDAAHHECFIANSVKTKITVEG